MSELTEMHSRVNSDVNTLLRKRDKEENKELRDILIRAELGLRTARHELADYLKATK